MTAKQVTIIVTSWLIVIAAFVAIYLTERGLVCSIAMIVLSIAVTAAVVATVFSDSSAQRHAME